MKNHELLDLIGEVNGDYVLEAGDNVTRPRFGWKKLAACAACAALVLAAYPVYRAVNPPLHGYTVVEGGGATLDTLGDIKAPAGGVDDPIVPGGAFVGGDSGDPGLDGEHYDVPGQDAPAQEEAMEQYDKLLKGMGLHGEGKWSEYPAWFAGAWIEGENLMVAIVEDCRTPELEARIREWTEGDIMFRSAKYSQSNLESLMDPVVEALRGTGLASGIGVDVMENCLGVDLYSNGAEIPDGVLAELAKLDPDGDAIRVRVFTGALSTLDGVVKCPPEPAADPVFDGTRVEPSIDTEPESEPTPIDGNAPVPGGATQPARQVEDLLEAKQPAIVSGADR